MNRSLVLSAVVAVATIFALPNAMGQSYRDAGSKAHGKFNSGSASRSMQNARSYSREYREYARSAPRVEPEVTKETTDAIGNYIVKAQKHMAWMRKEATKANDKDTLASLDSIDKSLADAAKSHKDMCDLCMKDNIDAAGPMKCCQEVDDSLTKAIDEHDKLMKKLGH